MINIGNRPLRKRNYTGNLRGGASDTSTDVTSSTEKRSDQGKRLTTESLLIFYIVTAMFCVQGIWGGREGSVACGKVDVI